MFLEVSATIQGMEQNGRLRAAEVYSRAVDELGLTPTEVARRGDIPDPDTVRDFMDGARWPQATTRAKLEKAIGWEAGSINALTRGEPPISAAAGDRVIAAIEASALTRANRHRLIAAYYDMLEQQEREGVRGA